MMSQGPMQVTVSSGPAPKNDAAHALPHQVTMPTQSKALAVVSGTSGPRSPSNEAAEEAACREDDECKVLYLGNGWYAQKDDPSGKRMRAQQTTRWLEMPEICQFPKVLNKYTKSYVHTGPCLKTGFDPKRLLKMLHEDPETLRKIGLLV